MKKNRAPQRAAAVPSLIKLLMVMKLSFLMIILGFSHLQAKVYSQGNITLAFQKTAIAKVIHKIEKEGQFRFLYNYDLADLKKKIDIKVTNASLDETLATLFFNTDLTYKLLDNNLVVVLSSTMQKQPVRITGRVTGANSEPLAGVTVQIKSTTTGTATDNNGTYAITAEENAVLVFSYIGYENLEIEVQGRNEVNAQLKPSEKQLDQIIVVGYGSQSRKNITGAVSTVSAEDIADRPIVNAAQAIQGKAAGVQVVQPSGKPGVGMTVRIRGANSISAGNDPLYVVDGVPTTDISSINPTDIETMSILKDASSAAIYGARAANGVVLITTKKGSGKKMKLGLNAYVGFSKPTHTLDVLNGKQYQALINEAYNDNIITDEIVAANNVNWPEEVFRTGVEQNYQLALSGGTDKFKQYFSLGYMDQTGMIKPAYFKRFTGRANLTHKTTSWLTLSTNLSFSNAVSRDVTDNASSSRGGVVLSALTTPFTVPKYAPDGTIGVNPNSGWENPLGTIEGSESHTRDNRFLGNFSAEVRLMPGLTFKSLLGLDYTDGYNYNILDPFLTIYGRQQEGTAGRTKSKETVWLTEQTLTYTKRFGSHHFSALAGFTTQTSRYDPSTINTGKFGRDTAAKGIDYILANSRNKPDTSGYATEWGLVSGIARITYEYNNRYLFTGNLRADASSKFPENNRTGIFPSFSAGWRISSERFFDNVNNVQELKLRAGWGMNGNQEGIGNYDYMKRYYKNPVTGDLTLVNFANPSLTWEKTTSVNVGLDITFLDSRIAVTADWYQKKTKDVLVRMPIPTTSGLDYISLNVGDMENKGFEFNISTLNIKGENLSWNTDFNMGFNRNKVLNLGDDPNVHIPAGDIYQRGNASLVKAGYPLGSFYGYVATGIDPQTGNVMYEDRDKNEEINPGDRTFIGNAQPDFIYGMTNTITFKNFDLSVFFQGSQGNKIFNGARIETEGMYDSRNQTTTVLNRWKAPGDVTDVPKALRNDVANTYISSRFVEDGSYLRLKAITLSYRFNSDFLKRMAISNASLYVTGQNVLTFTKYTGFDPEVSTYGNDANSNVKNIAQGIDYGAYPQSKAFIIGLNVAF